jgi:hypothetical protein
MREIQRQAAKQAVRQTGEGIASLLIDGLNKPEAYVDRIYESDRAYWEKLYGDDPVTSRNHPVSPPSSLLPPQPPDPSDGLFDPSPMGANASGPFGSGGQFVPGVPTSLQSPDGAAPRTGVESKPVRGLGVRIGDTPGTTVFDSGAPAVPFVSPSSIPRPPRHSTNASRLPWPRRARGPAPHRSTIWRRFAGHGSRRSWSHEAVHAPPKRQFESILCPP